MDILKGIIALDIDGTVVSDDRQIPTPVLQQLDALSHEGWQIAFITGRTFSYGYQVLQDCRFSYQYACYNGSLTFQMPACTVIRRHLLRTHRLVQIQDACLRAGTRPFVHLSYEQGDTCYWQPSHLEASTRQYADQRQHITGERWVAVEGVGDIPEDTFAYAKAFASRTALEPVKELLLASGGLAVDIIDDPLSLGNAVILITDQHATKGGALADLKQALPGLPSIAAGDDHNDLTLLAEADIGIAMGGAPEELVAIATLQAPPASEQGILVGLQEAFKWLL